MAEHTIRVETAEVPVEAVDYLLAPGDAPDTGWGVFENSFGMMLSSGYRLRAVFTDPAAAHEAQVVLDEREGTFEREVTGDPESNIYASRSFSAQEVIRTGLQAAISLRATYVPASEAERQAETLADVSLKERMEAYITVRKNWLDQAFGVIAREKGTMAAVELFERPTAETGKARKDGKSFALGAVTERLFRVVAGRFGLGGEQDVTAESVGMPTDEFVNLNEGGRARKVLAEASLPTEAGAYVFSGTKYRLVDDEERALVAEKRFGVAELPTEATEYDMVRAIAAAQPDDDSQPTFEALAEPIIEPYAYRYIGVDESKKPIFDFVKGPQDEESGQLIQIGTRGGKPVYVLRVDRTLAPTPENPKGYVGQPETGHLMSFLSDVLSANGYNDTAVCVTTSTTYPSRAIDALIAGARQGRQFGTAMYGRETLAVVEGKAVPEPTELNQFPGELRVLHDKLQLLAAEIAQL